MAAAPVAAAPTAEPIITQADMAAFELAYSKNVELTNGRWAMMGFAAAIITEAATGNGIIGQGIVYAKALGVLGPDSGF